MVEGDHISSADGWTPILGCAPEQTENQYVDSPRLARGCGRLRICLMREDRPRGLPPGMHGERSREGPMAQSYQPGTISHLARATGDIPKSSGFYERGAAAHGGGRFAVPREDGTIDVVDARNAAVIGSSDGAVLQIIAPEVAGHNPPRQSPQ